MNQEHEIVAMVAAARGDSLAADELVRRFLPFIRSETAKVIRRGVSDSDDELSVAMMAFHEAVLAYERLRGAFLPFAARAIRSRIIDFHRREQRHRGQLSLHEKNEDDRELADTLDVGTDPISERTDRTAARQEIAHFALGLSEFGLSLTDIADNCPKQARTLSACHRALDYARGNPELLEQTGGIVQGMSGSPILQDGCIVGAVTHVLLNDPCKGYGISIETMLNAAK